MINLPDKINNLPRQYQTMLEKIETNFPAIQQAQQGFFKTQSQFMDNMLTVSHPTPIRNLRQILAEITKTQQALNQATFKNKKRKIRIKQKEQKMVEADELSKELLQTEIEEIQNDILSTENYMKGAIRKVSAYIEQYNYILEATGKTDITEADFEKEEPIYHIAKAFEQALTSARSRGGLIDEGNHIYLYQIGINGAAAQMEVTNLLEKEAEVIASGKEPGHEMVIDWLEYVVKKYYQHPAIYAANKGMQLVDTDSLIANNI